MRLQTCANDSAIETLLLSTPHGPSRVQQRDDRFRRGVRLPSRFAMRHVPRAHQRAGFVLVRDVDIEPIGSSVCREWRWSVAQAAGVVELKLEV